ncbi:MAG: nucleotidyltransferase [Clostridiales bacterium]|nr:nucleotidyltransferase [Clostridiales bacterium]
MCDKVYTLDEIKALSMPIAMRHGVAKLYLFGSYARGEATPESDLDFRIEKGRIRNVLQLGSFLNDIEDAFQKNADVLTTQMLSKDFLESIRPEEVLIYAQN